MNSSLQQIREKISTAPGLSSEHKQELLGLVGNLYQELDALARTDSERARSVSSLAQEATSGQQENLSDLSSSVDELEVSHPRLVEVVNRICKMLSDIGI